MSTLQKQAINRIRVMSDQEIRFLMDLMEHIFPHQNVNLTKSDKINAYNNLRVEINEIKQFFPINFNPSEELAEALDEKYGSYKDKGYKIQL